MNRLISVVMTLVLLSQLVPTVSAKPKGDWNAVKALAIAIVAVKTKTGETHYGLMQDADDSGIRIQIAGEDRWTTQEITFKRDTVAKVWRARLRFSEKNVAKAAWIGAGLGLGVGLAASAIKGSTGSTDPPTWVALYPFFGAGVGAIVGTFWKKKHKKQELVYSI